MILQIARARQGIVAGVEGPPLADTPVSGPAVDDLGHDDVLPRAARAEEEPEVLADAGNRPAGDNGAPLPLERHDPTHLQAIIDGAYELGDELRVGREVVLFRNAADIVEEAAEVRLGVAVAAERRQVVGRRQVGRRVGSLGIVVRLERALLAAFLAVSAHPGFRFLGGGPGAGVVVVVVVERRGRV